MTIEEIFSSIANHMRVGLLFHNELINIYNFLNLDGYRKEQQQQYFQESHNYLNLKAFYLNQYGKMIVENETFERPKLIPDNWYRYQKKDVDTSTKRSAIRDLFQEWIKWEEKTKKLLNDCYLQLIELREVFSALKVKELLQDVCKELNRARKQQIDLETIGYDIVHIIDIQNKMTEDDEK